MPAPKAVCAVCHETVNKRSTLSLRQLGGGDGRACRKHEEVASLVASAEQNRLDSQQLKAASVRLGVMIAAAEVRVRCSMQGLPPEVVYDRFRLAGVHEGHILAIKREVEKLGGPIMSPSEKITLVFDTLRILAAR